MIILMILMEVQVILTGKSKQIQKWTVIMKVTKVILSNNVINKIMKCTVQAVDPCQI